MPIEIPNNFEAAGLFQPTFPGILGDGPIASSNGFRPYDPATTTLAPKGGFTATATGQYLLGLVDAIDPFEACALVQPVVGTTVIATSFIVPRVAPFTVPTDGRTVGVHLNDTDDVATDTDFYVLVFRFATGPRLPV